MTTYRAGQRVKVEYTGTVTGTRGGNPIVLQDGWVAGSDRFLGAGDGYTVTVLSEPRPDEPTGLGAVVEAQPNYAITRRRFVKFTNTPAHNGWIDDYGDAHAWGDLIDPVVLSEGLTP